MSDEIKDKDGLEEEISADSKENEQNRAVAWWRPL